MPTRQHWPTRRPERGAPTRPPRRRRARPGRSRVLARAQPGPARHPRLGPRLRRGRRAPGRARSGTSARRRRGRSSRRPPRSASTASRRWPSSTPTTTGPAAADRQRGAVLGRRGHRHGDHGHVARRRRDLRPGHARADGRVDPAVLRQRGRRSWRAFCVSEPDAGSDVSSIRTRARYDEASGEWVLNGQKAWATNGGIANVHVIVASVDRELGSRGQAAFVVPPGTPGLRAGRQGQEARPARVAHRRRLPRRLPRPGRLPARRQGEARRAPRARPRGQALARPGGDADLRGHAPDRRRAGDRASPAPPTSTRSSTRRSASSSAARSSRTRRSPSRSPT